MSYVSESGFRKSKLFSLTNTGYQGFAFAIMNRQDEPPIYLRSELTTYVRFSGEKPLCDMNCRAIHTNKRTIEHRAKKQQKLEEGTGQDVTYWQFSHNYFNLENPNQLQKYLLCL